MASRILTVKSDDNIILKTQVINKSDKLTSKPQKNEVQKKKAKAAPKPKLYCICRKPYKAGQDMIACDSCDEWFHFECVGITKAQANRKKTYMCPTCAAVEHCLCNKPFDKNMITCDGCENLYHPKCLGMTAEQIKTIKTEPFFCTGCEETFQSPTGIALHEGLEDFMQEMKMTDLQSVLGRIQKDVKKSEKSGNKVVSASLGHALAAKANKDATIGKLIKYGLCVGVVPFLLKFSADQLKAFLKKKSLPVSGSKEHLASRVHGVWFQPAKMGEMELQAGETVHQFMMKTWLLQMFYQEKLGYYTEESKANSLSHKQLDAYISQRNWHGLSSASKLQKLQRVMEGLLLVDEHRDFVSYIAPDITKPILEPTQKIDACISNPAELNAFLATFHSDTLRAQLSAYDVKGKEKWGKKADLVTKLVQLLTSANFAEPSNIAKYTLALGAKHAESDPMGYFNLLSATANNLLLKGFPSSTWFVPNLVAALETVGELDVTEGRSAMCQQIDPLLRAFWEITVGEQSELDALLGAFDQFSIDPTKKKEAEKEKKRAEKEKLKQKAKKAQLKAEKAAKPKRATSAYNFFCAAVRPEVTASNPSATFGEISKITGAMWQGMKKKQKKEYQVKADADKERYLEEMAQWQLTRKPKKAASAYMLFVKAKRNELAAANPDMDFAALSRFLGSSWKDTTEEERQPFYAAQAEDVKRYEAELAEWKAKQQPETSA